MKLKKEHSWTLVVTVLKNCGIHCEGYLDHVRVSPRNANRAIDCAKRSGIFLRKGEMHKEGTRILYFNAEEVVKAKEV